MGDWKFITVPSKDVEPAIEVELTAGRTKAAAQAAQCAIKERTQATQVTQGDTKCSSTCASDDDLNSWLLGDTNRYAGKSRRAKHPAVGRKWGSV